MNSFSTSKIILYKARSKKQKGTHEVRRSILGCRKEYFSQMFFKYRWERFCKKTCFKAFKDTLIISIDSKRHLVLIGLNSAESLTKVRGPVFPELQNQQIVQVLPCRHHLFSWNHDIKTEAPPVRSSLQKPYKLSWIEIVSGSYFASRLVVPIPWKYVRQSIISFL